MRYQDTKRKLLFASRVSRHGWATTYPAVGINYRPPHSPQSGTPLAVIRRRLGIDGDFNPTLARIGLNKSQVRRMLA